jgi:tetratricopeptide (TPR) repeat protein
MGHCYLLQLDVDEALATFSRLAQTCTTAGYRWLLAQSLTAKANAQVHLKQYSWALKTSQQALEISQAIGDANGAVKTSSQIAQEYLYLNNYRKSLTMHRQCLELLSNRPSELIQQWRSNFQIAQALYFLGLYSAALEYQMESLRLAKELKITQLISRSYTNLALLYAARKDYSAAESAIGLALEAGASYPDEKARAEALAYSFLQLGSLYRQAGDCERAIKSFDKALNLYNSLRSQAFTYVANKGKLLCCLEQGGCPALDDQLAVTLEMFEQHRSKILEESNKNLFFDVEQSVYDAAIEFQHTVKGNRETSFEYSEACRARSLYDM